MDKIESHFKRNDLSAENQKIEIKEENIKDRMSETLKNFSNTDSDIASNFTNIYNEISNLYVKIKALRAAGDRKCSLKKCDNNRKAIKKLKMEVAFLKMINVTEVNNTIVQINTFTTTVTDLQTSVSKVNNCFIDINSADCDAFRKKLRHNSKVSSRQSSTEPLIPLLRSVIACMAKTSDSKCTDKFK